MEKVNKEKKDNGGWLLIKVFVIFFSLAAFFGIMENLRENRPKTGPLPIGFYDRVIGQYIEVLQ